MTSRHVFQLSTDPGDQLKIYRVQTGDEVYISLSCELSAFNLNITFTDPTGKKVTLSSESSNLTRCNEVSFNSGNYGLPLLGSFLLPIAGPYTVSFKSPLNLEEVHKTVLADPIITWCDTVDQDCGLNIDNVAAQTHLTKCCGGVDEWEDIFGVTVESGYNMVHLTPIQELGVSGSAYSLHSHLQLSNSLKLNTSGYEVDLQVFGEKLHELHDNTGLLFLTDVVWNHVSICNTDINEHPGSYFNLFNTPNLIPAYLIDRNIAKFGSMLSDVSEIKDLRSFEERLRSSLEEVRMALEMLYKVDDISGDGDLVNAGSEETPCDMIFKLWTVDYTKCKQGGRINGELFKQWLFNRGHSSDIDTEHVVQAEIDLFNTINIPRYVQELLNQVITAVIGTVKYRFLDPQGLELEFKTVNLVDRYFHVSDVTFAEEFCLDLYSKTDAEQIKTCNGWKSGDSIKDMSETMAYTRREVVIWADTVKLRYGKCRDDSPWLWAYMERYTCDMARIFQGFRIDNCHNTPLHVGVELLKCARNIRTNLYVVAELFTENEDIDSRIINALGINSCIRELSQAHSPKHLGELIYHYGESKPCGSFAMTCRVTPGITATRLLPSRPHAMLLDQSHDNPCPFDQHPIPNVLALAGAMCAAKCAKGSNRGYDELVPHHIHVVKEKRKYHSNTAVSKPEGRLNKAKFSLLKLHKYLESYSETFVHQATEDVIIVTRHNPLTCDKVLVVIATKWSEYSESTCTHTISLPGEETKILLEIDINSTNSSPSISAEFISGLSGVVVNVEESPLKSSHISVVANALQEISFNLTPGCVFAVEVKALEPVKLAMNYFNTLASGESDFLDRMYEVCLPLDLHDLNYIMYRCHGEEKASGCGGVYNIPGFGDLSYAGIVGFVHVLEKIKQSNNTGHPLCKNLYEEWWMAKYICNRLKHYKLGIYLEEVFESLGSVPHYMRPKVFDFVTSAVYSACIRRVEDLIPDFYQKPWFHQQLILTSVQLVGKLGNTGIHSLPNSDGSAVSMSAGIPHFSHGFMRCWGRDTFIALPGLLISTHRLADAKELIVGFARTLRYGLIPNLLSESGHKPRYNCRDAVWWWCRAVRLMYEKEPGILSEKVCRLYNSDDTKVTFGTVFECTVLDVIHEVLKRHAEGITFIEENAGSTLDEHLNEAGFSVSAGVDSETGFVWGGSPSNCGTWMDKVGSSDVAGNRGIPATPRDGCAIELVGLSYLTVSWMSELFEAGFCEIHTVLLQISCGGTTKLSFKQWAGLIRDNFEKYFWSSSGGFYKDTVSIPTDDRVEEFRPNQTITMVVAPELFDDSHLSIALKNIGTDLTGPVGMKTLGPNEPNYRPYYETSNSSTDYSTAHGFNYHQGPEWVWCMGFYLRAKLQWEIRRGLKNIRGFYKTVLAPHRAMIAASPLRGLTELTNRDGAFCAGSCETQAWSSGAILELLTDIQGIVATD